MRVVVDTNVFISGVFFGGYPSRVLDAWRDGRITLVLSPAILREFERVGEDLSERYEGLDLPVFTALAVTHGEIVADSSIADGATSDPDDDKFFACAMTAGVSVIVSGDAAVLRASGWKGIEALAPKAFVERYLDGPAS